VDKSEMSSKFKLLGREMEHKLNEEFVKFKFKSDEHMANMVSEEKFKIALGKTVN
jgi:hypothetical protein